jgi:hypothetical protein
LKGAAHRANSPPAENRSRPVHPVLRFVARVAIAAFVCFGATFVPLIPVTIAPVVPHPIEEAALISIQRLVASPFVIGVSIQGTWLTLPMLILVPVSALVGGWLLSGLIFRRAGTSAVVGANGS